MEQHVLMENTYVDPVTTTVANQAPPEAMKENLVAIGQSESEHSENYKN